MQAGLEGLGGSRLHVTVNDRGFVHDVRGEISPGADARVQSALDSAARALEDAMIPLPAEALGAGAKFRVERARTINGVALAETLLVELVGAPGGHAELKVVVTQRARPQSVEVPGGASMALGEYSARGKGQWTLSPGAAPGTVGRTRLRVSSAGKLATGSRTTTMATTSRLQIRVNSVE